MLAITYAHGVGAIKATEHAAIHFPNAALHPCKYKIIYLNFNYYFALVKQ